jgi:hypothetical protein
MRQRPSRWALSQGGGGWVAGHNQKMSKPLRCVLRLHKWHTRHNEAGQRYQTCDSCGAYRDKITLTDTAGYS